MLSSPSSSSSSWAYTGAAATALPALLERAAAATVFAFLNNIFSFSVFLYFRLYYTLGAGAGARFFGCAFFAGAFFLGGSTGAGASTLGLTEEALAFGVTSSSSSSKLLSSFSSSSSSSFSPAPRLLRLVFETAPFFPCFSIVTKTTTKKNLSHLFRSSSNSRFSGWERRVGMMLHVTLVDDFLNFNSGLRCLFFGLIDHFHEMQVNHVIMTQLLEGRGASIKLFDALLIETEH
jgi:hypothetical protein